MKEYHIIVSGTVQGVCFRATTKQRAQQFSIKGFVKNLADGTVKIVALGPEKLINEFLDSLKKDAGAARITRVDIEKKDSTASFESFDIKY